MSACSTCAFGKCGGAADEANNRFKGKISARGPIPFFCHHAKSGAEYDWQNPDSLGPLSLPPTDRKICAGWKVEVAKLAAKGKFNFSDNSADNAILRRYQRSLASDAIRALDAFLEGGLSEEEKELRRGRLEDLTRAVWGLP